MAVTELKKMRKDGGRSIVELSCGGLMPDPHGLVHVAREADVHVIMGCGHYVDEYQNPENADRTIDSFTEEMVSQVFDGAWGTEIRAGIIGEIGCQTPWTPLERRVMKAAALAQDVTGASLNVHPGRRPDQPQEVVDFLTDEGTDVSRVVMSYIDRTIF